MTVTPPAAPPERPASSLMAALPRQFFADLIARAEARRAEGHDVINLGQGNPDLATPEPVVEALRRAAGRPEYQRYTPFRGLPALKQAVCAWYRRRFGVRLDPEREVAILIGAKVALGELPLAVVEPGDAVLVPDPGYPDYLSGVALARARAVPLDLLPERAYLPDWARADASARLAYVNYPHNPTGAAATPAAMAEAAAFGLRTGCIVVHDYAYGDIRFDGRPAVSFLAAEGGVAAGLELVTLSKSHSMAGWRIAFAAGRADVIGHLETLQDHLHCGPFAAIQEAAITALSPALDHAVAECARVYQRRRDTFVAACAAAGWPIPPSAGSIFVWCPVPGGLTSAAFAALVLTEADVVVAPGAAFGRRGEGHVRVAITAPEERLEEAAARIGRVCQAHRLVPGT
jgi:aminotransferase